MHWFLLLACELCGCVCHIYGQMCFGIRVFTCTRKQFSPETQCAVLSVFVTMEEVLVNTAEISPITTGYFRGFPHSLNASVNISETISLVVPTSFLIDHS